MKNIVKKSLFLMLGCLMASTAWATPITNLNFEITSGTTSLPSNYVYSTTNPPSIKTQNGITCIIVSDGGGSNAPTFNGTSAPSGGKRWIAFCPDVDCSVTIGIMSNKKKFFIQNASGEFYSYTNTANAVEEQTVTGLKAGQWYAMCGGSSQVYITKMAFVADGNSGTTPTDPDPTDPDPTDPTPSDPTPSTGGNTYAFWRFSGDNPPALNTSESGTKMTVEFLSSDDSKSFSTENATYNAAVTDEDLKSQGSKGLKMGANALYLKVTVTGGFKANDVVKICGYNPWKISSTAEQTGNIAASLATGTEKKDYNIASFTLTEDAAALYMMRAQSSGTGICAIKVERSGSTTPTDPDPTDPQSTDNTLQSLKYNGTDVQGFSAATLTYNIELPAGTTAIPTVTATANDTKATVLITPAKALPGSTTIKVTAENGNAQTYTIHFTVASQEQPVDPTPTDPDPVDPTPIVSGLTTHAPEIYEEPKANKGYGGTLSTFNSREYEVYYIGRDASDNPSVNIIASGEKVKGLSTSSSANAFKADDNWFEVKNCGGKGGDSNSSAKDEFKSSSTYSIKFKENQEMTFQVKGFDQFNFYGKDNNPDGTKGKQFEVYIDDKKVSSSPINGYAIHRYEMSTAEHVIRLVGIGGSESKLTGFSLRVSNDPLVRHLNGSKDQTVYQTKDIAPVAFRVRRAASHRFTWVGNAIPGVTLVDGTNDTVFVQGTADAATGVYTYKIEALDASGAVGSTETGTITINTHVFDNRTGNNATTNLGEAIKPMQFVFYASSTESISLLWGANGAVDGLSLTYQRDSIAILSGTPSALNQGGTYPYSIVAAGGNTVTGEITLLVPDPAFDAIAVAKIKDNTSLVFTVQSRHASNVTAEGLPSWLSLTFTSATGIATISGTPNVGGPYPKTFTFTLTATPAYMGKEAVSTSAKVLVIDPAMRTVLLVCKDLATEQDDPVAKHLMDKGYDVTLRTQDQLAGSSMEAFDMILISENADANHEAVLDLVKSAPKPLLNMKAFTYIYERDEDTPTGWGEPDNGSLTNRGRKIFIQRADHPIFKKLGWKQGDSIAILNPASAEVTINKKGLMPIKIFRQGTYCLATALTRNKTNYYGDGELQTFLHEEPAAMRGGNKYICMPMAITGSEHLSVDGKKLLEAVVNYLFDPEPAAIQRVPLQITSFSIDGVAGVIEEDEYEGTINVAIDSRSHPNIDLRKVAPVITVASEYTHVIPASGDTIDAYWSYFNAVPYTVTDYINRYVYNVTVTIYDSQDIEAVYTAGEWVNIFDIYGRKIATTNENVYRMALPRGIYIIVTEDGKSLKIMR